MIFQLKQQNKIQDEMEYYDCKKEGTMKKVVRTHISHNISKNEKLNAFGIITIMSTR